MKFSLISIFTFILVFSFSVFAQKERVKGFEFYQKGDYKSAIHYLNLVRKEIKKDDAEFWHILGMSYFKVSDFNESRKAFEKVVKLKPQNAEFHINLAYANLLSNRIRQAEKDIKKAIALDSKNATAFYIRGLVFLWKGKFDNAIADADQSISLDKTAQVSYFLKSNAYLYKFGQAFENESAPAVILEALQKSVETLEACATNCTRNSDSTVNQTKLDELKIFYQYFSTRKTLDIDKSAPSPNIDPSIAPLTVLTKPRANYTDSARQAGVQGEIALAVLFSADGKTKMILVLKPLSNGLTEQAIKAAEKITFDPQMKDGKPVSVVKIVKYSFTLY